MPHTREGGPPNANLLIVELSILLTDPSIQLSSSNTLIATMSKTNEIPQVSYLSQGAFGKVYQAHDQPMAYKTVSDNEHGECLLKEFEM